MTRHKAKDADPVVVWVGSYPEEQALVVRLVDKWKRLLGIDAWMVIKLRFNECALEGENDARLIARTTSDWEYRQASIWWYLPNVAGQTEEAVEQTVVHELVHTLTASMESLVPAKHNKECEYAVEGLAQAIFSVSRRANVKP